MRLYGIQFGRGIAALLVVLLHASHNIALPNYSGIVPFSGLFEFGHAGVDFFFVLSGFIIYFVHGGDIGRPDRLGRYVWRRVTRIYPPYWAMTGIIVALAIFKARGFSTLDPEWLVRSLLLLPGAQEPILGVAWTLIHEMAFYTVFALLIMNRRLGLGVFAIWLVSILLYGGRDQHTLTSIPSYFEILFFMGIFAAFAVRRWDVPFPRTLALLGSLAFFATGMAEVAGWIDGHDGILARLLYGASSTAAVVGLADSERRGTLQFGSAAAFLGNASYSIYLTHTLTVGIAAKGLAAMDLFRLLPGDVTFLLTVLFALVAGSAFHLVVERPTQSLAATISRTWSARHPGMEQRAGPSAPV